MNTTATNINQIKVTLPSQLHGYLKTKADKYGLTLSAYVKNLIIDDVKETSIPTFPMNAEQEQVVLKALQEHEEGRTEEIKNVDEFINSL